MPGMKPKNDPGFIDFVVFESIIFTPLPPYGCYTLLSLTTN